MGCWSRSSPYQLDAVWRGNLRAPKLGDSLEEACVQFGGPAQPGPAVGRVIALVACEGSAHEVLLLWGIAAACSDPDLQPSGCSHQTHQLDCRLPHGSPGACLQNTV